MTYEVVMPYHLHMPSYFLGTFTEYPFFVLYVNKPKVTIQSAPTVNHWIVTLDFCPPLFVSDIYF